VIVVDDGSSDATQSFLSSYAATFPLQVFRQVNQGPAAARNVAIQASNAELIISLDDDVIADPGLVRAHLEAHETEERLAAMGVMALPGGRRLSGWLEFEAVSLNKQYQSMQQGQWQPSPRQFYTANASFRRRDALSVGLFDTTFRRAEDVELAYRLRDDGVSFAFLPEAIVYHEPNRPYADWLRVPYLYGHYDHAMVNKGRKYLMNNVRSEFKTRNRWLRTVARRLVGRRHLQQGFVGAAGIAGRSLHRFGARRISYAAFSAIFNIQYWQGLCDNLGGREAFWNMIDQDSSTDGHRRLVRT
jgi:GT2 family glycosyltransferase